MRIYIYSGYFGHRLAGGNMCGVGNLCGRSWCSISVSCFHVFRGEMGKRCHMEYFYDSLTKMVMRTLGAQVAVATQCMLHAYYLAHDAC